MVTDYRSAIIADLDELDGAAYRAWYERDNERLRHGLLAAITFATFSIHTSVPVAEMETCQYIRRIRTPLALATRREKTLTAAWAVITPEYAAKLYRLDAADALHSLMRDVWGLGPAKASFSLAIAGFHKIACVDRWIARRYGVEQAELKRLTRPDTNIAKWRYLAMLDRIYPGQDSRLAQWLDFAEDVPAFRASLHRPVTSLILSAYAGGVTVPDPRAMWGES